MVLLMTGGGRGAFVIFLAIWGVKYEVHKQPYKFIKLIQGVGTVHTPFKH